MQNQNIQAIYKGIFSTSMFKPIQEGKLIFNDENYLGDGQLNFSQAANYVCDKGLVDEIQFKSLRAIASRLHNFLILNADYNKRDTILKNVASILEYYIGFKNCLCAISRSLKSIDPDSLSMRDKNRVFYMQSIIDLQIEILRANEVFFVDLNSRLCDAIKKGDDFTDTSIDSILQNPTQNTKVIYISDPQKLKVFGRGGVNSVYECSEKTADGLLKPGKTFLRPTNQIDDSQEISMGNINPNAYKELEEAQQDPNKNPEEIKRKYEVLVNTAFRANIAYELANLLNFDCIVKTEVGLSANDYVSIMDMAHGKPAAEILAERKDLKVNLEFIKTNLELNIIDYILLSADRHDKNWFIDVKQEVLGKVTGIDNDFINPFDNIYEDLKGNPDKVHLSWLFIKTKIPFVTPEIKKAFEIPTAYFRNILLLALPNNMRAVEQILNRFEYAKARVNSLQAIDLENDQHLKERFSDPANELLDQIPDKLVQPKIHGNNISTIALFYKKEIDIEKKVDVESQIYIER